MTLTEFINKIDEIKALVVRYSALFDEKSLIKEIKKFESAIKSKLKWPDDVKSILDKLKKKNLRTTRKLINDLNLTVNGNNKAEIIFNLGFLLIEDHKIKEELNNLLLAKTRKKRSKQKVYVSKENTIDLIERWLDMKDEDLRSELSALTVRELREITKGILSSNQRRKRKKELIDIIIFKMKELKHQMEMGPA
ncbi:MAG: hypothetical protein ACTSVW_01195 [Candidatus Njordarchaeales archaeon]